MGIQLNRMRREGETEEERKNGDGETGRKIEGERDNHTQHQWSN